MKVKMSKFDLICVFSLLLFAVLLTTSLGSSTTRITRKCSGSNCTQGRDKVPIRRSSNLSALPTNSTKTCPDQQTSCEDDETCCPLNIGGFGCCDPDHARCCGDGVHCCPNDKRKSPRKSIFKKINHIPLKSKSLVARNNGNVTVNVGDTVCPTGSFVCPNDNTCCQDPDGEWACCNLPKAVCCSDGLHCCPSGYKCRVDIGQCVKSQKRRISIL